MALSTLSAATILVSSLTLAVAPIATDAAEAYEAPAAGQLVRTSNNVWTQTNTSGLQITYSTGTSTTVVGSATADTADTTAIRGTPTLTAGGPLVTYSAAVPAVTASNCSQPNTVVGRWICSNQATMTVTFSQPTTNPRLYIGRIGGSSGNQARVFGIDARLTASVPGGVTLTNLNSATSTFESTTTSFGATTAYTGNSGDCSGTADSAGCGSLQLTGAGITSVTFAIDMEIKQQLLSNTTGGTDEFTLMVTDNQQFSNGPASYNGTGGSNAPFHVQGPLQLGSAFTTAGISTTQNTTASPTAGTATGAGDAFTASSLQLRASQVGSAVSLAVPLSGTTQAGKVCGWLDWDHSGTYEAGERACASFATGATSATLTWTMPASGTTSGPINARFRAAFGSADLEPTGGLASGEVEDYTFAVKPTIAVTNSASSSAGATFTYGVTAGGTAATLLSGGAPGATSGIKSLYNSSAYGAPDITIAQDVSTTAVPIVVTQTQPSSDTATYGVTYSCLNAAGTSVASGNLGNSGAGTVKTIPSFSLPANASTNAAAQAVTCTFTNTKRVLTAGNDTATVAQNGSVATNVLANDATTSGNAIAPASVTVTTAPARGTTSINTTTGAITYTPTPGYVGTDSYSYQVCDSTSPNPVCGTATVTVTVTGNTVTAVNDTVTTTPGVAVSTNVRANDTSATGQALANPTITTAPTRGTATVNSSTGAVLYTPAAGFSGVDSYVYQVCDTSTPTPVCSSATATVTVPNQFTNGTAAAGITTPQNTAKALTIGDIVTVTGAPINPAAVTLASAPANGTVAINASTGAVTYTPTPGYSGTDSFSIQLCDTSTPTVACRTVVVPVTVGANTVTAGNDTATTSPQTAVTINVKANDTTATGQALGSPAIVTAPTKGTVVVNPAGTVTYTPSAGTSGTDTFTYRVCDTSTPTAVCSSPATVTVTVPNAFTNGAAAAGVTTPQNTARVLTTSDIVTVTGAPIDPTKITVTTAPVNGTVAINTTTGAVTYTPNPGYTGSDTFTLQLCDKSTPAAACKSVTVPVTVGANAVVANPDTATTNPVTAVTIPVRANDTTATGQALANPTIVAAPARGTAVVNAAGTVTYTPQSGFSGADTFTYRVCDTSTPTPICDTSTVTVTVPNQFTNGTAAAGIATPQNTARVLTTTDVVTVTGAPIDPTKITVTSAATNGTVAINTTTGAVTYTPNAGYTGADSFTLQLCDKSTPTAACKSVTVPVTVGANTVTAVNDSATTNPATVVNINVRANDTTASGQALANPTVQAAPTKGTAVVNATTGQIAYTPNAGTSGTDTFTYRVCDTSTPTAVCSNTATVTVTVPNQFTNGPAAAGITTPQNTAKVLSPADVVTVTGAPIDPAKVTVVTSPAHGSIAINTTTGAVTYTPTPGYAGADSFALQLCDTSTPTASCKSVTVPVTVGGNAVTAANDTATTSPVTAVTIAVRANDTTATGQALANPTIATAPARGTAVVNAAGTVTYTPQSGFSGVDTFTYTVCDTSTPTAFCSNTATVTVTVPNQFTNGPAAAGITTPQNTAKVLTPTDIVTVAGAPIDPTKITVTTAPANGSISISTTTGAVTYTPNAGYSGADSFRLQLCDRSTPTAACTSVTVPVTVGANTVTAVDDSSSTTPQTAVSINVTGNDTTATGQALGNPTVVAAPAHGSAVVDTATGRITYTPAAGFSGVDTFTYRVVDTSTPTPVTSNVATVTVTVPNQFTNGTAAAGITTPQNTAKVLSPSDIVTVTGAAIDPTKITVTTAPAHGAVSINTTTGAVTYTPTAGYSGSDTFSLQLCDRSTPTVACRTVTVPVTVGANAVTAGNDTATTNPGASVDINVRGNDTTATGQPLANPAILAAPANGTAVVNTTTGRVRYTPATGFSGVDTFTYRVCDTSTPTPVCATASVTVTVPNQFTNGPAATGITTPQNTAKLLSTADIVTTTGAPINPAGITVSTAPAHGSISINATTGAVTYTPTPGYAGSDSFALQLCDTSTPTPSCRTVTIPVTVGGNTVTAVNDGATTTPGTFVDVNVRGNDTTTSGQPLANPSIVTTPAHGTAVVNATTGAIRYTPAAAFSGVDTFTYTVCDTSTPTPFCSNAATVTVTVPNQFTAGTAAAGITTPQNTAKVLSTTDVVTVTGAPIDPTKITVTTAPAHGAISIDTTSGAVTYTPTAGYSGADTFTLQLCDTSTPTVACRAVTVPVTVGANTVTAANDTATTTPVTSVSIDVRANDTTATGQPLGNPVVVAAPGHGSTSVDTSTGRIVYTPAAGFSGVDTFTYRVSDTSTPTPFSSNTATVTVTVPNQFTNGTAAGGVTTTQNTAKVLGIADIVTVTGAPIDPTAVTVVVQPGHGTVSVNATTGAVTYTPAPGYAGADSFSIQLCDRSTPTVACRTVVIPVTVGGNVVTAVDDTASTTPSTAVTINVRGNDATTSGQALAVPTNVSTPAHGSAVVNATTGAVTYTPAAGFSGVDTFTYRVCDTSTPTAFCSNTATVTVNVPNQFTVGPAAAGVTTPQNTPKVLARTDLITVTGAPISNTAITVVAAPAHGAISIDTTSGAVTYTPAAGYSGSDSFSIQLCDTSTPSPVCRTVVVPVTVGTNTVTAVADTATTPPVTPISIDVRANDTTASGQPLGTPTVVVQPGHGTAVVDTATGRITYTPAAQFSGQDTFTYSICDTSATPICSTAATVTVDVPNTLIPGPILLNGFTTPQNTPRVMQPTEIATTTGAPVNRSGITVQTAPSHGSVTNNPATGEIIYTPTPGYSGPDTFVLQGCDLSTPVPVCQTLTFNGVVGTNTVTAVNDSVNTLPQSPVVISVLANDTSASGQALQAPVVQNAPAHGTATVDPTSKQVTYTPAAGFSGSDSFTYTVRDTSTPSAVMSNIATVTINVPNQFTNGPATGGVTTAQNTPVTSTVAQLITVTGAAINPAAVTVTTPPTHGSTSVDTTTGAVTYTPVNGYSGSDSYVVQLCDLSTPTVVCRSVTIPVTVGTNSVDAVDDTATTPPVTPVRIDVKVNDTSSSGQPLGIPTIFTAPARGSTSIDGTTGAITYTPNSLFSGVDSFVYRVCDTSAPTPFCDTATVTVNVPNELIPGPVITDGFTTPQNTPRVMQPLEVARTTGAPVNRSGITQLIPPSHGVVTNNTQNGVITYTPNPGYSGTDTFTLQGCDLSTPTPECRTLTFNGVVGGNTVTAAGDAVTTNPATPVTIGVLANDTSASGQSLGAPVVQTAAGHGSTSVDPATKQITYTPAAGFSGVDTFTYTVCDTSSPTQYCSSAATVTITVPNTLTAGAAAAGVTTPQNTPKVLAATDLVTVSGAAVDPTKITVTTPPAHGAITIDTTSGAVTYTPTSGYSGTDSFALQLCDASLPASSVSCLTVTVPVTVGANAVTAIDDTATTPPVTAVSIDVKANDTSATGQPLGTPMSVSTPGHGTATVDAGTGRIVYTPAAGFSGVDTFTYRVADTSTPTPVLSNVATVTVTVPNAFTAGTAAGGRATAQNTPTVITLPQLVTTTGAAPDPAGITISSAPSNGSVSINATTGAITYTPAPGYTGGDSFVVRACDQSTPTPSCTLVTIPIAVGANTVTAVADTASTTPQSPVDINVRGNDTSTSGQPLASPSSISTPGHGTAVLDTATGHIVYTPAAGFSGVDTFTYRVCDTSTPTPVCSAPATVTVNVPNQFTNGTAAAGITTPQNTPMTLLRDDVVTVTGAPIDATKITVASAPAHGAITIDATSGAVTYTPAAGYSGTDTFTLQLCDRSTPTAACRSVVVPVTVGANAVTAVDDTATTPPVTAVSIDVKANDTSATGQPLGTPTSVSTPGHGTATVDAGTGRIVYTPAAGFSGVDTFTYRVADTSTPTPVLSNVATVTVTVPNSFTAGTAAGGVATPQNTPRVVPLSSIVTTTGAMPDPAGLSVTAAPAHGTISINATTGALTYTPTPGYTGADTFTVQTCDRSTPTPACFSVVIPVTVGANAVTAVDDTATTTPTTAVDINVRGNDTSTSGQALASPSSISTPGHGTAVLDTATGHIVYTPAAGFSGVDTFTYRVCDTSTPTPVCSSAATVTVTVPNTYTAGTLPSITTPQNTSAIRTPAQLTTPGGAAIDPTQVTLTTAPVHGSVSINATSGAVTYTPTPGYSGSDSFVVRLCDTSLPVSAVSCTSVAVPVTVGVNAVTAVADDVSTNAGVVIDIDVRGNDTSASGQAFAAPTVTVNAAHGTTAVQADGRIRYTPVAGFSGRDTFTYRVCDTSTPTALCATALVAVTVANVLGDGTAAAGVATPQNTAKTLPITQIVTVTGAPIAPSAVTVATAPLHGSITIDAGTGAVTYTPTPGYTGADSFRIQACDASQPTPYCRTVTVPVTVGANLVDAKDDTAATVPSTAVDIDVRLNDTSASGQSLAAPTIITAPGHGTAVVDAGTGHIVYTPAAAFSGVDTFGYRVCDTSSPTPICDPAVVTVSVPNQFTPAGTSVTTPQNTDATLTIAQLVTVTGAPINPAAVTVASAPLHGSIVIDSSTGTVTYRPTAGYSGTDSFRVQLCDTSTPTRACTSVTVPVTVGTNTVTANADPTTTPIQTAVPIDVRANDTSLSGQALALPTIVVQPTRGTVTIAGTGIVTYTPAAGFSGVDTFTYRVCDTSATPVCATAPVTVTVPQVFQAGPAAAGVSTGQNQTLTLPAADIVVAKGAPFDFGLSTVATAAQHGTATVNPSTGVVTYVPQPGYTGTDTFQVRYCDTSTPTAVCTTRTVQVTVGANAVDAKDDTATTSPQTLVNIAVATNDTSASGQALGAPVVTVAPAHGTATVRADGTIDYTPAALFSGADAFTYRVCDTSATPVCDSAVVTVTVPNAFAAGPAVTDGVTVAQNGSVQVANTAIAQVTGAPLANGGVSVTVAALHGSTVVNTATGVVSYTPAPGYVGSDRFTAQVCDSSTPTPACRSFVVSVTVTANTVVAVDDTGATTPTVPVVVDVVANDTSATGQSLAAPAVVTLPAHGATAVVAGGIRYTPAAGFSGVDTFEYRICDTSSTAQCDVGLVTVTVPNQFTPGIAVTTGATTAQNAPIVIPRPSIVTTTGATIPGSGVSVIAGPAHGTVSVNPTNGAITYTPAAGYAGSDSITVRACDASTPTSVCNDYVVPITVSANAVAAGNDAATVAAGSTVDISVRANDTSSSGQPLAFPAVTAPAAAHGTTSVQADGRIRYTPDAGYSGTDTFGYTVCDTSATPVCASATVSITVNNVFTPGAAASGIATPQNTPQDVTAAQLVTTAGAAIDVTRVTVATAPLHGTISIDTVTGVVTYTPTGGYTGADSFRIQLCDQATPSQCTAVTVPVSVGANTVVANPDTASTTAATAVPVDVRANDTTASGQALAAPTVTSAPAHGTTSVAPGTGIITYTPAAGFSGTDSFSYRVCDTSSTPVCDTDTATITIANVFTPGPAGSGTRATAQNQATTFTLPQLMTVTGSPLSPAKVTIATAPAHGSIAISATTGAVTYTPAPGYSGPDSFVVQTCDTSTPTAQCSSVAVAVSVGANTVDAVDDAYTTPPTTSITVGVRTNDTTASGQALGNPAILTGPTHGSVTVNAASGDITYLPDTAWSGVDTFVYRVCDTSATPVCDDATVTITVPNRFIDGPAVPPGIVKTPQNTAIAVPLADIVTTTGAPIDANGVTTTVPAHGSVSVDPVARTVTYTPDAGYTGSDAFDITLCDLGTPQACVSYTMTVAVGANSVAANNDTATLNASPGASTTITVLANDSSASGQPLGLPTVTTTPAHGSTTVDAAGVVTYTPVGGFSGTDAFVYTLCDTSATPVCDTATVTVTVANVFTPGPAAGGTTTGQNTAKVLTIADLVSTSGAAINPAQVTISTPPSALHGSLSVNTTTGAVTYQPSPGYTGPDSFAVRLCDLSTPTPSCTIVTVPITVGGNTLSINADTASTTPGIAVTIPVLVNDTSGTGQAFAVPTVTTAPAHGTAVPLGDGSIRYTPAAGFSGVDTFRYTVCDTSTPTAVCGDALVTVNVPNGIAAGTAASGVSVPRNGSLDLPLATLATTTGAGLNPAAVTVADPPHGTATVAADGSIHYEPDPGYTGTDTITYTVCDLSTPTPVCRSFSAPVVVGSGQVVANADVATTSPVTPVAIDVRVNDDSQTGTALGVPTVVTAPAHGSTLVLGDGRIQYTPAAGFSGADSFRYRVCDGSATPVCAQAIVTVNVPNQFTDGSAHAGVAVAQNSSVVIGLAQIATTSGAPLRPSTVTVTSGPAAGTVTVNPTTGAVTFTPTPGFAGTDSITVRVCDASTPTPACTLVTIPITVAGGAVTAGNDTASTTATTPVTITVKANDGSSTGQALGAPSVVGAGAAHGTVTVVGSALQYVPDAGFSGTDTFTYQVCDTSTPTPACTTALVTVTVDNVFTPGTAAAGVTTPLDTAVTVPLADIVTPKGLPIAPGAVTIVGAPAHGTAVVDPITGAVTFTPTTGYVGPDTVRVRTCDGNGQCATVTLPIVVQGPVVAVGNDAATTVAGQPIMIDVEANDAAYSGYALAAPTIVTAPAHGTVTVMPDGRIRYTPDPGYTGTDTFTYQVCDTAPVPTCAVGSVTVAVSAAGAGGAGGGLALTGSGLPVAAGLSAVGAIIAGLVLVLLAGLRRRPRGTAPRHVARLN